VKASSAYPSWAVVIVLLVSDWAVRALLRAQLIEEGFDVVATDTWEMMLPWLSPDSTPALAIVDLQGLVNPESVLEELKTRLGSNCVLALGAAATLGPEQIHAYGVRVLSRPIDIGSVVAAAARAVAEAAAVSHPPER